MCRDRPGTGHARARATERGGIRSAGHDEQARCDEAFHVSTGCETHASRTKPATRVVSVLDDREYQPVGLGPGIFSTNRGCHRSHIVRERPSTSRRASRPRPSDDDPTRNESILSALAPAMTGRAGSLLLTSYRDVDRARSSCYCERRHRMTDALVRRRVNGDRRWRTSCGSWVLRRCSVRVPATRKAALCRPRAAVRVRSRRPAPAERSARKEARGPVQFRQARLPEARRAAFQEREAPGQEYRRAAPRTAA